MSFIAGLGMQAAGQAVGNFLDILTQGARNKQQFRQAQRLQGLQIEGNKEMIDYQKAADLQMWKDTNYQAQKRELEAAGLNAGLLYGMSGGGGATTGGSASVSGQSAETARGMGINPMEGALMQAQKEDIEADTKLKLTDAAKKAGADTANIEANTALTKAQTAFQKLQTAQSPAEFEANMEKISRETEKIIQEAIAKNKENYITEQTKDDQILTIKREALGALYKNLNTLADTALKGEQKRVAKETAYQLEQETRIMIENKSLGWEELTEKMRARYALYKNLNTLADTALKGEQKRVAKETAYQLEQETRIMIANVS